MNKFLSINLAIILLMALSSVVPAQCRTLQRDVFVQTNDNGTQERKPILLTANSTAADNPNKIIFFETSMRVNTDGAPNSYHPQDLTGSVKAINNICNGISVRKINRNGTTTKVKCSEARRIFGLYQANDWIVPSGYRISWQNVLAARTENGKIFPCIFRTGDFTGYLGSLTGTNNGLTGAAAGECDANNQLDQRFIPAFVLPGGTNALTRLGAKSGDLMLVYNPLNNAMSAAIIGDTGPAQKLGEGSVGLNKILLGKTELPKTYREALSFDTGEKVMLVAIIPNSKNYSPPTKPYTVENIKNRLNSRIAAAGFADQQAFADFMKTCR